MGDEEKGREMTMIGSGDDEEGEDDTMEVHDSNNDEGVTVMTMPAQQDPTTKDPPHTSSLMSNCSWGGLWVE